MIRRTVLLLCFLLLICLCAYPAQAAIRHVGSGQSYSSIADAISASSSGDTIVVHEGTYSEYYLQPASGTTIISARRYDAGTYGSENMPIVDAGQIEYHSSDNYDCFVLYPSKSNITFDGLYLLDGGRDCIRLTDSGCSNIIIQYCKLEISGWSGYAGDNAAASISTRTATPAGRSGIIQLYPPLPGFTASSGSGGETGLSRTTPLQYPAMVVAARTRTAFSGSTAVLAQIRCR